MKTQQWFSTKLRFIVLVEPTGGDIFHDCLFLIKAEDFKSAFDRALSIGNKEENKYRNVEDKIVLRKFVEIISLDIISNRDLDGAELNSELQRSSRTVSFMQTFAPEMSKPIQTI